MAFLEFFLKIRKKDNNFGVSLIMLSVSLECIERLPIIGYLLKKQMAESRKFQRVEVVTWGLICKSHNKEQKQN
ncbi:hypothetical protein NQ317_002730 [Molorchus minor]|uniref:Uncharacterized protein n=1 Tax=Molorchus minor TaxID=1323400 RepID=A0ABQ9K5T7_9CUCU|nr:hypothetical protein NQ317_002730 [Molorchus minor]